MDSTSIRWSESDHVIYLIFDSSHLSNIIIDFRIKMASNLAAFSYIVALIGDAFLIFFSIFHVRSIMYLTYYI